jgi:hypothetical protein
MSTRKLTDEEILLFRRVQDIAQGIHDKEWNGAYREIAAYIEDVLFAERQADDASSVVRGEQ